MTSMHRVRHQNAYRAGCRDGARAMAEAILALLPREHHDDLDRLTERVVSREDWQRIPNDRRKSDGED